MSGIFSEAFKEQVRAASDIVDVIGSYIPLKKAGANFTALCPFHKEKSPSFNVMPHKQFYYCFGCHKGGDVFKFVQDHESIPFPDALRRLAERAKIPVPEDLEPGGQFNRHLKDTLLQIHEQITQRWQNALANEAAGQPARDYLSRRGVSPDAVKLFRLGFAPEAWDDTVNWAKSKGHDLEIVEQAGLILRKEGGSHYDRFRGRLIFPICDEQGRVIGFSGRVLAADVKAAKYVNSPETPIFTKGRVFFGLDKSKRALLDEETAIVCEGQLDLIACFMAGVQNIVAPQGTALTADHARILKRYVEEVVLCFDSDNAGQNAAVRSLDSLLASGLAIRVAVVPPPHDPDSFIKESGGAAFRELIAKAEGFFDYYLNRLCATNDLTSDRGRLEVVRDMAAAVHKTGNGVLIDKYAQKTALRLGVSPAAMRLEFQKAARMKTPVPAPEEPGDDVPLEAIAGDEPETRPSEMEIWLLRLVLSQDDSAEWLAGHFDLDWLQHPRVREIIARRLAGREDYRGIAHFMAQFEDSSSHNLVAESAAAARPVPDPAGQLAGLALRFRNQFLDRQIAAIMARLGQPETGTESHVELTQQLQLLRQAKKQPLSPLPGSTDEPF